MNLNNLNVKLTSNANYRSLQSNKKEQIGAIIKGYEDYANAVSSSFYSKLDELRDEESKRIKRQETWGTILTVGTLGGYQMMKGVVNGLTDYVTGLVEMGTKLVNNIGQVFVNDSGFNMDEKGFWDEVGRDLLYTVADPILSIGEGLTRSTFSLGNAFGIYDNKEFNFMMDETGRQFNKTRRNLLEGSSGDILKDGLTIGGSQKTNFGDEIIDAHNFDWSKEFATNVANSGNWFKEKITPHITGVASLGIGYGIEALGTNEIGDFLGGTMESVGRMIPAIASTVLGGESSQLASIMSKTYFFSSSFGASFGEAIEKGADINGAYTYAFSNAMVETLTEQIGGIQLGKLVPSDIVKSMFEEGMEEVYAELVSSGLESIISDEDVDNDDLWGFMGRGMYSFLGGAMSAGVMSGGSKIYNKRTTVGKTIELQKELQDLYKSSNKDFGKTQSKFNKQLQSTLDSYNNYGLLDRNMIDNALLQNENNTQEDIKKRSPVEKKIEFLENAGFASLLIEFDQDSQSFKLTKQGLEMQKDLKGYMVGKQNGVNLDVENLAISSETDAGLIHNKDIEFATREQVENIKDIKKKNIIKELLTKNRNIAFVNNLDGVDGFLMMDNGFMYVDINLKNADMIAKVTSHEILHKSKVANNKGFNKMMDLLKDKKIIKTLNDNGITLMSKEMENAYRREYMKQTNNNVELTNKLIQEEMLANLIEKVIVNENTLDKIFNLSPELIQSLDSATKNKLLSTNKKLGKIERLFTKYGKQANMYNQGSLVSAIERNRQQTTYIKVDGRIYKMPKELTGFFNSNNPNNIEAGLNETHFIMDANMQPIDRKYSDFSKKEIIEFFKLFDVNENISIDDVVENLLIEYDNVRDYREIIGTKFAFIWSIFQQNETLRQAFTSKVDILIKDKYEQGLEDGKIVNEDRQEGVDRVSDAKLFRNIFALNYIIGNPNYIGSVSLHDSNVYKNEARYMGLFNEGKGGFTVSKNILNVNNDYRLNNKNKYDFITAFEDNELASVFNNNDSKISQELRDFMIKTLNVENIIAGNTKLVEVYERWGFKEDYRYPYNPKAMSEWSNSYNNFLVYNGDINNVEPIYSGLVMKKIKETKRLTLDDIKNDSNINFETYKTIERFLEKNPNAIKSIDDGGYGNGDSMFIYLKNSYLSKTTDVYDMVSAINMKDMKKELDSVFKGTVSQVVDAMIDYGVNDANSIIKYIDKNDLTNEIINNIYDYVDYFSSLDVDNESNGMDFYLGSNQNSDFQQFLNDLSNNNIDLEQEINIEIEDKVELPNVIEVEQKNDLETIDIIENENTLAQEEVDLTNVVEVVEEVKRKETSKRGDITNGIENSKEIVVFNKNIKKSYKEYNKNKYLNEVTKRQKRINDIDLKELATKDNGKKRVALIQSLFEDYGHLISKNYSKSELYNHLTNNIVQEIILQINDNFSGNGFNNYDALIDGLFSVVSDTMSYMDNVFTNNDVNKLNTRNPEGYQYTRLMNWGLRELSQANNKTQLKTLLDSTKITPIFNMIDALVNMDMENNDSILLAKATIRNFFRASTVQQVNSMSLHSGGEYAQTIPNVLKQNETHIDNLLELTGYNTLVDENDATKGYKKTDGVLGKYKMFDKLSGTRLDMYAFGNIFGMFMEDSTGNVMTKRIYDAQMKQLEVSNQFYDYFEKDGYLKKNRKNIDLLEKQTSKIENLKDKNGNSVSIPNSQVIYLRGVMLREIVRDRLIEFEHRGGEQSNRFNDGSYIYINGNSNNRNKNKGNKIQVKIENSLELFNELNAIVEGDNFMKNYNNKVLGFFELMYDYENARNKDISGLELTNDRDTIALLNEEQRKRLIEGLGDVDITNIYVPMRVEGANKGASSGSFSINNVIDLGIDDGMVMGISENNNPPLIDSINNIVPSYARSVANFYGLYRIVNDLNILFNKEISLDDGKSITLTTKVEELSPYIIKYYEKLLRDISGYSTQADDTSLTFNKFMGNVRRNFFKASLGLNIKVITTQFASMFTVATMYGDYNGNSAKMTANMIKNMFTRGSKTKAQYLIDNSVIYKDRARNSTYERSEATSGKFNKSKFNEVTEMFMGGINRTDSMINRAFFITLVESGMSQEQALIVTEEAINRYQSSGLAISKNELLRTENELVRVFTKFLGEPMKITSNMEESIKNLQLIKALKENRVEINEKMDSKVKALDVDIENLKENYDKLQKSITSDKDSKQIAVIESDMDKVQKEIDNVEIKKKETIDNNIKFDKQIQSVINKEEEVKKIFAKRVSALVVSVTWQALLGLGFGLLRGNLGDKEEEEAIWAYLSKQMGWQLASEMVSFLPFARDVYSLIIERYDANVIGDFQAFNNLGGTINGILVDITNGGEFNYGKHIRNTSLHLGQVLGLPTRQIERLFTTPANFFMKSANYTYKDLTGQRISSKDLNVAIKNNDEKLISTIIDRNMKKKNVSMTYLVSEEINRLARDGIVVNPSGIPDSFSIDGIEYKNNKELFAKVYDNASFVVEKIITGSGYKRLDSEHQGKLIKAIYNYYHQLAKQEVSGVEIFTKDRTYNLNQAYNYFKGRIPYYSNMMKKKQKKERTN